MVHIRIFWMFVTFLFSGLFHCDSQKNGNHVIARVEDETVTLAEYRERMNNILMYTTQDNAELHDAVYQNLINEKVLIHEAKKRGYDQTSDYQIEKKRIELDNILDVYQEHVASKRIQVTEDDIKDAFRLNHEQVRARILYAPTEEKANFYYQEIKNGKTFEELAPKAFKDPRLAKSGGDMGYSSWEDMELPLSEAGQKLKVGEISKPVMSRSGWYIIKVEDRFCPPYSENNYNNEHKKLKWIVTHRKKMKAIREYTDELLEELNISYNEPVLEALMKEVPSNSSLTDEAFADYGLSENQLVATVDGQPWTLGTFHDKAQWTSLRQKRSVKDVAGLKRFIEGMAVRDVLLKKAYTEGIQTQSLQKKIQKQFELYLIEKMNRQIMDTVRVSEKEAMVYYERFKDQFVFSPMADVREILVDSPKTAENLAERVRSGENFATLAQEYSLRKRAAERGGELGYGTKAQYGMHGDKIFSMKIGEICGPLKNDSYYIIIQIIGFRPSQQKTFEQAKAEIEDLLIEEKKHKVLLQTIDEMRKHLHIEYNDTIG